MLPFNMQLPVAIGCDHAGFDYKDDLISFLEGRGIAFTDFGTHSKDSVDYPDFAHPVALAVEKGEAAFGILLCGSANGVAITANKHQGIRAAICWGEELAQLARQHNDANIICIPARFVREGDAEKMVDLFMTTPFEGGRHQNRVNKIACS
jgi:ribose 5-phosphate isomerase B